MAFHDSTEIILLDNCEEHTHDQIRNKARLSPEMLDFITDLYSNGTANHEQVIKHINPARLKKKKNSKMRVTPPIDSMNIV